MKRTQAAADDFKHVLGIDLARRWTRRRAADQGVPRLVEDGCRAAGLPGKLVHDFRRSAVRNLIRAGVSEHVAMRLVGHKTSSMLRPYDIVSTQDLREAVEKLAKRESQR